MPAKNSNAPTATENDESFSFAEEPSRDERKRYTTQLQRRAQAHITAELGGTTVVPDTDRQVTMVVQHAQESTGARRVSFFRPVTRGRRWHVATVLGDGTFYYGLACPETLGWSRMSFEQRRPVLLDARHRKSDGGPNLSDVGLRSYLGVPVLADGRSVAVIEAVDVNQTGELEFYSSQLEETASTLAQRLDDHNKQIEESQVQTGSSDLELNADSVVDLILRQPYEVDETFEVAPTEWAILICVNGERQLRAVAEQASMPISQVVSVTTSLGERGLIRVGKENRRRL
jgi:GAF domain-containing protein